MAAGVGVVSVATSTSVCVLFCWLVGFIGLLIGVVFVANYLCFCFFLCWLVG